MGHDFIDAGESASLSTLRRLLLCTLVFGASGMMGELLLIGHVESVAQFVASLRS